MKKSGLLLLVSLLAFDLHAQVTLTSSDIAGPGKIIFQANDTLPTISVGAAGAGQTWNFLGTLNASSIDTLTFMPLTDAPNYVDFPTTNVVFPLNIVGDLSYGVNNMTNLSISAVADNRILFPGAELETIVTTNTPAEKMLEFPVTYNSTFSQHFKTLAQFFYGSVPPNARPLTSDSRSFDETLAVKCGYSDSLRERRTFDKTVIADAWGTLTTAAGTFNVTRVKETKYSYDTIEAHDAFLLAWFTYKTYRNSTTTYYWYANGIGVPLVAAYEDSVGTLVNVKWQAAVPTALGINEAESSSATVVYPNPANEEVTIYSSDAKASFIEVYDITGRMIKIYPVNNERTEVNTSGYSAGMYSYVISGKDKRSVSRGKFSIAK